VSSAVGYDRQEEKVAGAQLGCNQAADQYWKRYFLGFTAT